MEEEVKEILNELNSLKQSLTDPSHQAPINKVKSSQFRIGFFGSNSQNSESLSILHDI